MKGIIQALSGLLASILVLVLCASFNGWRSESPMQGTSQVGEPSMRAVSPGDGEQVGART